MIFIANMEHGHNHNNFDNIKIEAFPIQTAGAPVSSSAPLLSDYTQYGHQLGAEGPYAPFKSKLDWEIAQWAKIQGPSSRAVADLLSIDGVCILSVMVMYLLLMSNSLFRLWVFHTRIYENSTT
jgi:hypothetical protein